MQDCALHFLCCSAVSCSITSTPVCCTSLCLARHIAIHFRLGRPALFAARRGQRESALPRCVVPAVLPWLLDWDGHNSWFCLEQRYVLQQRRSSSQSQASFQTFDAGDPKLLTHGIDKFGFVCGSNNTLSDGTVVDLTDRQYLYYLDPFALLNVSNLPWAESICVDSCPSVADLCEVGGLPCKNSIQYR